MCLQYSDFFSGARTSTMSMKIAPTGANLAASARALFEYRARPSARGGLRKTSRRPTGCALLLRLCLRRLARLLLTMPLTIPSVVASATPGTCSKPVPFLVAVCKRRFSDLRNAQSCRSCRVNSWNYACRHMARTCAATQAPRQSTASVLQRTFWMIHRLTK